MVYLFWPNKPVVRRIVSGKFRKLASFATMIVVNESYLHFLSTFRPVWVRVRIKLAKITFRVIKLMTKGIEKKKRL